MNNHKLQKLFSELKIVKLILKIFTYLIFVSIILNLLNLITINTYIYFLIYYIFLLFFIGFIWFKMPITTYDKIGETLLIVCFGIFALWMWIPDKKELVELLNKTSKTET